jgi:hypothetical protein
MSTGSTIGGMSSRLSARLPTSSFHSRTPTSPEPSAATLAEQRFTSSPWISVDGLEGGRGGVQCNAGQEAAHLCQIDQFVTA